MSILSINTTGAKRRRLLANYLAMGGKLEYPHQVLYTRIAFYVSVFATIVNITLFIALLRGLI